MPLNVSVNYLFRIFLNVVCFPDETGLHPLTGVPGSLPIQLQPQTSFSGLYLLMFIHCCLKTSQNSLMWHLGALCHSPTPCPPASAPGIPPCLDTSFHLLALTACPVSSCFHSLSIPSCFLSQTAPSAWALSLTLLAWRLPTCPSSQTLLLKHPVLL